MDDNLQPVTVTGIPDPVTRLLRDHGWLQTGAPKLQHGGSAPQERNMQRCRDGAPGRRDPTGQLITLLVGCGCGAQVELPLAHRQDGERWWVGQCQCAAVLYHVTA